MVTRRIRRRPRIEGDKADVPQAAARYVLAVGFILAGTLHFLRTATYARIVPPTLGHPEAIVYVSGACEMLGGLGALLPQTRRLAGAGLVTLLIAVFPANIYMAMHPALFADLAPPAALLWRLPLQFVLVAWVWWCCF